MIGGYQFYYGRLGGGGSPSPPPPVPPPYVPPAPVPQYASAPSGGGGGGVTWVSMPKTPAEKKPFTELEMVPLRLLLTKLVDEAPKRATGDLEDLVHRSEQKIFEQDTRAQIQTEYDRTRALEEHAQVFVRAAESQLFAAELDQARAETVSSRRDAAERVEALEARLRETQALVQDLQQALAIRETSAPVLVPIGATPEPRSGWPWYTYAALAVGALAVVYLVWPKPPAPPDPPPARARRKRRRGKLGP